MNAAEFEKIVARSCIRAVSTCQYPTPLEHGDKGAVIFGAFLSDIATAAGMTLPQARRHMKALEATGRLLRNDTAGGRTRWWLAGLAADRRAPTASITHDGCTTKEQGDREATATARQTLTKQHAPVERQHWSEVLGVERDCSTSTARAAFGEALRALDETDPDYPNQRQRVHAAIDACCCEHEIQVTE